MTSSAARTTCFWWARAESEKNQLLEGIGRRACALGYRARYVASDELLADLGASLSDRTTRKRVRYYTRLSLNSVRDGVRPLGQLLFHS